MHAFELLWIVLLRFAPLPRVWAICLIAVNLGALFFLGTYYGRVALLAALAGVAVMIVIYSRLGFVRLLGIGHVFWIPMLIWFASDLPSQQTNPDLYWWVIALMAFNSLSLIIDAVDVLRYLRGERAPHYHWHQS
ncbi:MAG: hypothetical protein AB3N15_15270 [Paracoccaceae bacterium]